jgi:2-keto-3-deoxy-L-rhamnonate aldolase RhmA
MGFAHGLHVAHGNDVPAMLASPQMGPFYEKVAAACAKAGVEAGVFCLGRERAAALAGQGYRAVAFDTDLNALISYAQSTVGALR